MRSRLVLFSLVFISFLCSAQSKYAGKYRPQYHFTPPQNFMNDANGMIFFEGEYHLFYQHNPKGNIWGHMSWGHAVSPDMVHWQNLPVAIPEHKEFMIFSGSSVVDDRNASGLCGKGPCIVSMYTADTKGWQRQNLAYSLDRGRTFTDYSGNPVVDEKKPDFRDPKFFWYEPQKKYVLVTVFADERFARFYESRDLKTWKFLSQFGPAGTTDGQWECPDLVELPIEGTDQKKWVLMISRNPGAPQGGTGVQYFVGNFDGTKFTNETPDNVKQWIDYGKDFYATQRFSSMPDQRIVWMGWTSNWKYANQEPTSPWRGAQSIPRELFLRKCTEGYCVVQRPVRELHSLREKPQPIKGTASLPSASFEADWQMNSAGTLIVTDASNSIIVIGYDPSANQVYVDRTRSAKANFSPDFPGKHAAKIAAAHSAKFHLYIDQSTLELFVNDGERVFTDRVYLSGPVKLKWSQTSSISGTLWKMKSIWK